MGTTDEPPKDAEWAKRVLEELDQGASASDAAASSMAAHNGSPQDVEKQDIGAEGHDESEAANDGSEASSSGLLKHKDEEEEEDPDAPEACDRGMSLCCLSVENPVRAFCIAVANNAWWERFILFCIIVSTVVMAMSSPVWYPEKSEGFKILEQIDFVTNCIFTVEMFILIFAQVRTLISLIERADLLFSGFLFRENILPIRTCQQT